MKKLYYKTIDVSIYNYDVPVFYGDLELLNIWANNRYNDFPEEATRNKKGFCYIDEPEKYITPDFIYIGKTKKDYATIAHEALHCALLLLYHCDVAIRGSDTSEHEALAYLTGYLVGEITKNNWSEYPKKRKGGKQNK